jgi:RNA polymerase sigma-70 factor (ECF subfamily)
MGRSDAIPSMSTCAVGTPTRPDTGVPDREPAESADLTFDAAASEAMSLVARAHGGERKAQSLLLAKLGQPLRNIVQRLLDSEDELEDVLQDVWMQVFRSLPSYRGQAQLLLWAERIAVRTTFRHLRAKLRMSEVPASRPAQRGCGGIESYSGAGAGAEPNADAREALRRLHAVLDNLKPPYRAAFILFQLDGKSLREVAATTDASLPATKSRIIRARHRIAKAARADKLLEPYIATARPRTGAKGTVV